MNDNEQDNRPSDDSEQRHEAITDYLDMEYVYLDGPGDHTIRPARYPATLNPPRPTPPNTNPPTPPTPPEEAGS